MKFPFSLSLLCHAFCNNQFCSGSPLFLLRDKWNTWTLYLKNVNHTSKIKVYMCTCVTPNEIFPYLFLCRAMLSPTINFVPTLHCSYQKIRETHEHGWHFKKVEHHTSKIKVYMCARVTSNEIFPSLFLCRTMLSPTTNFSLSLHCSC